MNHVLSLTTLLLEQERYLFIRCLPELPEWHMKLACARIGKKTNNKSMGGERDIGVIGES